MKINILPSMVFNRIAAGEVVDKPASALKELVENSIDAGATEIIIEVEDGGKKKISITDNGSGIDPDDIKSAFLPHATSKIKNVEDLESISTLGFRGEALASIASVSQVTLTSRTASNDSGRRLSVNGGEFGKITEIASQIGTQIVVNNLFYNTPARAKFLRKSKSEENDITGVVEKFMLAHPEISFKYTVNGEEIYNTKSCVLSDIIYTIYGKDTHSALIPIEENYSNMGVSGYITLPNAARSNRSHQHLFVNDRAVENYTISAAVQRAYEAFLMKGKFPIFVLKIKVPFDSVDVNVHPSKKEVKFENGGAIFSLIHSVVERALQKANHIESVIFEEPVKVLTKTPFVPTETISQDEGKSFKPNIPLPDFDSVTNKNDKEDRIVKNGLVFFDQALSSNLKEIKVSADKRKTEIVENEIMKEVAESFSVVGVLFSTYIIVQQGEEVYFIDQHAAHERQRYDVLKKEIDGNNITKQDLLVPYILTVAAVDYAKVDGAIKGLEAVGFEISEFGGNSLKISSVPSVLSGINLKNFFDDVIATAGEWNKKAGDILTDTLAQIACKGAVKAGDTLSYSQIEYILSNMKNGVLLCPHGRPIVTSFKKKDLEKWFKRVL